MRLQWCKNNRDVNFFSCLYQTEIHAVLNENVSIISTHDTYKYCYIFLDCIKYVLFNIVLK